MLWYRGMCYWAPINTKKLSNNPVKINFPLGFIEIKKNLEEIVMTGPVSDIEKITVKI